jgi:hypothetical protein
MVLYILTFTFLDMQQVSWTHNVFRFQHNFCFGNYSCRKIFSNTHSKYAQKWEYVFM